MIGEVAFMNIFLNTKNDVWCIVYRKKGEVIIGLDFGGYDKAIAVY